MRFKGRLLSVNSTFQSLCSDRLQHKGLTTGSSQNHTTRKIITQRYRKPLLIACEAPLLYDRGNFYPINDRTPLITLRYLLMSTFSSWLIRTRFVPTRIRSSFLSFSRLSRSLECPWCWMRTQSLFISPKFKRMKSTESSTVPESFSLMI